MVERIKTLHTMFQQAGLDWGVEPDMHVWVMDIFTGWVTDDPAGVILRHITDGTGTAGHVVAVFVRASDSITC